jgi:NAD(P)-dependent dehydrogenase (short-subunit alcohol dehydrogenase family)
VCSYTTVRDAADGPAHRTPDTAGLKRRRALAPDDNRTSFMWERALREAAAAVHFLAAEDASFITGQALAVDGGKTAGPAVATLDTLARAGAQPGGFPT